MMNDWWRHHVLHSVKIKYVVVRICTLALSCRKHSLLTTHTSSSTVRGRRSNHHEVIIYCWLLITMRGYFAVICINRAGQFTLAFLDNLKLINLVLVRVVLFLKFVVILILIIIFFGSLVIFFRIRENKVLSADLLIWLLLIV